MRKVLNTVPYFNIVAQTTENTVVTEYEPVKNRPDFYQSEAELEREFIILLAEQGYKYLQIHNEKDLIANLRHQLEEMNGRSSLPRLLPTPMKELRRNPGKFRRILCRF